MTLQALQIHFKQSLADQYPTEEIQSFFSILASEILGYSRFQVSLNKTEVIDKKQVLQFEDALTKLKEYHPIQYIIGHTEFYGLPFKVNEHTLIPRPETEELVEWILKDANDNSKFLSESKSSTINNQQSPIDNHLDILDIGTGSGCIAISLKEHLPLATVSALDISEEALKMAELNSVMNNVTVDFMKHDVLNATSFLKEYDIIVSNPPYVRELEKKMMQDNVLKYEPEGALFVSDEDPLIFYRTIARLAKTHLKEDGFLYFEINEYLGEEMRAILIEEDFENIEIKKDIFGRDRMLKCSFKK